MEKKRINDNPARFSIPKTQTKKVLFLKKEVMRLAICDENEVPLTDFAFEYISDYNDGVVRAGIHNKSYLFDINGRPLMQKYTDSGYEVNYDQGRFLVYKKSENKEGLFNKQEKALIDPEEKLSNGKYNNYLQCDGDIIVYGYRSMVSADFTKLGLGKIENGIFVSIIPPIYNIVAPFENHVYLVGRTVVSQTREVASLTRDRVTTTAKSAFQLYSADTGETVSNLVFGEIHPTKKGNYSAIVYPRIKPDNLHHVQTFSEAFQGAGLLDFSEEKQMVLDSSFQIR